MLNINIEGLETHVESNGSDPAGKPFEMKLDLAVPRQTPIVMLREYLTQLCNEMNITFQLESA